MHKLRLCALAVLAVMFLAVAGCGGKNAVTEFYSLNPILATPKLNIAPMGDFSRRTIALGPLTMPAYLTSRAQIVTQTDANQLDVMENARWAEPLDTNITMVLTDNLAYLLNCGSIVQYPWRASTAFDFRAETIIFAMTANAEQAVLRGRYRLTATAGDRVYDGEFAYAEELPAYTPGAIVAAYNRMLDELSMEIAERLITLAR